MALILIADLGGPTMFARIGMMRALNRHHVREFNLSRKEHHWGRRSSRGTNDGMGICRHQKQVGDKDHLKVFASDDAAETWLQENDPEGVAFEYEVLD
jgi:hypothetical protein